LVASLSQIAEFAYSLANLTQRETSRALSLERSSGQSMAIFFFLYPKHTCGWFTRSPNLAPRRTGEINFSPSHPSWPAFLSPLAYFLGLTHNSTEKGTRELLTISKNMSAAGARLDFSTRQSIIGPRSHQNFPK
jgi:hypothetical protein